MSRLNNMSGKEWIKFTKSWFHLSGKQRKKDVIKHPAKYPEELVDHFINFFTHENDLVFDPFLGVGSTLVSAQRNNRYGLGIEINKKFIQIAKKRCKKTNTIIAGDVRKKIKNIKNNSIDFIMTSPPYWDILSKKRGNSDSQHTDRAKKQLPLTYSNLKDDLSNIKDYDVFLDEIISIFKTCLSKLKKGKYMVIVVQNFRNIDGNFITYAWDIASHVSKYATFCGEKIWLQDDKKLGIWGFPSTFVPNIHHHYCLIFRKNEK